MASIGCVHGLLTSARCWAVRSWMSKLDSRSEPANTGWSRRRGFYRCAPRLNPKRYAA